MTLKFAFYIFRNDFVQSSSLALMYLVVSLQEEFDARLFFSFTLYVVVFRLLSDLAERYSVLQSAFSAASRLFDLMEVFPEEGSGQSISRIKTIEFKVVWFAYTSGEWVLKGVSFKIEEEKSIALVRQTGSGKTTIMSLILRFYDIDKGEILIDDQPIRSYNLDDLRSCFNVILQDPVIFSGTLAENII